MVNIILLLVIIGYFAYALYEQFGIERSKGKTLLKVRLQKRTKLDSIIFIALIGIIIFQAKGQMENFTIYLLSFLILLSLYSAFWHKPYLVLKNKGGFFESIYLSYDKIQSLNLANEYKLVINLKNGKKLVALLTNQTDTDAVVSFFGGYKMPEKGNTE